MNNIDFISAKLKKQNISDETCLEMFPLTSADSRTCLQIFNMKYLPRI